MSEAMGRSISRHGDARDSVIFGALVKVTLLLLDTAPAATRHRPAVLGIHLTSGQTPNVSAVLHANAEPQPRAPVRACPPVSRAPGALCADQAAPHAHARTHRAVEGVGRDAAVVGLVPRLERRVVPRGQVGVGHAALAPARARHSAGERRSKEGAKAARHEPPTARAPATHSEVVSWWSPRMSLNISAGPPYGLSLHRTVLCGGSPLFLAAGESSWREGQIF